MFRAVTRTVLLDQAKASSSMKRVEDASDASAMSPCLAPASVTSNKCAAPPATDGRSSGVSMTNSRWPTGSVGVPQSSAGAVYGSP